MIWFLYYPFSSGTTYDCLCGCDPKFGHPTLDQYSFKPMPVLLFDKAQYECLQAFLEYLPRVPELRKCGTIIIRPVRQGIIEFADIKEKIDAVPVERVLRQKMKFFGKCVVPLSTDVKKRGWTGKDFFNTGSGINEDPAEQIIEFFRQLKVKDILEDYASDISKALTDGHPYIDLTKLAQDSCLKYDPDFKRGRILKGIHESFFYLSRKNTTAAIHREDVDMGSLNLMLWAEDKAEKLWFATGVDDCFNVQVRLTHLSYNVMDNGPKSFSVGNLCCSHFYRRKGLFVPLDVFEEWMTTDFDDTWTIHPPVQVYLGHQKPGDLVVTFPRSWHQVYNSGTLLLF